MEATELALKETKTSSAFVLKISVVAALGGLLFGYDTAVIAGAIGFLEIKFSLSPAMVGWAASSAIWGCVLGAMVAGYMSDRWGRKKVLILTSVLFAISGGWIGYTSRSCNIYFCQVCWRHCYRRGVYAFATLHC